MTLCAYQPCKKRAVHEDHIMPWARRRKEHDFHDTVPACFYHNMRKGNLPVVPHGYPTLEELKRLVPWTNWKEWGGKESLL